MSHVHLGGVRESETSPPEQPNPLRVAPFRWAMGVQCVFIGALMVIEPHQFGSPQYRAIQPNLQLWGPAFMAVGVGLLYLGAFMPRTVAGIVVHAIASVVLLLLGIGFGAVGVWNGAVIYSLFGLGTIAAAILPLVARGRWRRGDLMVLVAGIAGSAIGLLMLVAPSQFGSSVYDVIRAGLKWYGAAFFMSGIGSIAVEIGLIRTRLFKHAIYLLSGVMFLVFLVKVAWPSPPGVLQYAGLSYAVGVQPWLARRLRPFDPFSLRTRSALILVAIAALPVIGAVAIVADQAGQVARLQALAQQQTLAVALAADADDYIHLHRAAAAVVAASPGLLDVPVETRLAALRNFKAEYPDVVAFSLFGADGSPLGRSDDTPQVPSAVGFPVYDETRASNTASIDIRLSTVTNRPIFAFGAPIRDPNGQFAGLVAESIESTLIASRITRASGGQDMLAYLVDAEGRVIAHPDAALVASFADLSATPPVAALRSATAADGTMAYSAADGERLVGYAALNEFGGGVIVERTTTLALASVRAARELAFDILLAVLAVAVLVALVSIRWLTRPLAVLAAAAHRHSQGDYVAPLPTSRLTEIALLASAFRLMRANVDTRTSERDLVTVELRDSEGRLRQLMDGVPVGIFVMDADGKPYYANAAALALLGRGISPDAGLGDLASVYQLYVAETDELYATEKLPIVRALAGELVSADDLEVRPPGGGPILLDVRAGPIRGENGRIEFAMATFSDISQRQRLEVQLRNARDEALDASRAKSAFLATMSHEIRTPMNGVIGMSGLLIDTELTPRQFEYADAVRRSGEALLTIINDILDFSKIEAGKLEIEHVAADPQEAVEDVVELLAEQAHAKGLELAALGDPEIPLVMLGDPGRIRQVLMNLVGNAVKFTQHGEVVVRTRLVERTATSALVRFEVTDTGIGISQAAVVQLFQPFTQADSSTTRKFGGTGLGLAICKGLVERMGGTIGVDSELGRGSTFWFTVTLTGTATPGIARNSVVGLRGLRVLAVDDNATNRTIVYEQLTGGGLVVTTVADAQSALEHLRQAAASSWPFALVVLDMHMPEIDGLQLAERIRIEPSIARTPLVLLTSVGERGHSEIFAAVLTKPARPSQLLSTIASVLGVQASVPRAQGALLESAVMVRPTETSGPLVLVAEDTSVNQLVARRMLETLGCRVDVVSNGGEAVAALQAIPYALVMMDVQMPEMDGFEATAEIRRREGTEHKHTPIIAMTANALEGDQERCLTAGMDDYVSKPVRLQELEIVVRRWLVVDDRPLAVPSSVLSGIAA